LETRGRLSSTTISASDPAPIQSRTGDGTAGIAKVLSEADCLLG
jgi:hypothetical protein